MIKDKKLLVNSILTKLELLQSNITMDVCWNVWITGDTNTKYRVLSKPIDF